MNTFNESFERIDTAIEKILQTVERIKKRKTMTRTQISNATMNAIINDINAGKFSYIGTNYKFYNDREKGYLIGLTSRVDDNLYLTDYEVDILDNNGNELELCIEQYNELEHALDKDLMFQLQESISEAQYRKYLQDTYA